MCPSVMQKAPYPPSPATEARSQAHNGAPVNTSTSLHGRLESWPASRRLDRAGKSRPRGRQQQAGHPVAMIRASRRASQDRGALVLGTQRRAAQGASEQAILSRSMPHMSWRKITS